MNGIFIPIWVVTLIIGIIIGWVTGGAALWLLYKMATKNDHS